MKKIYSPEDKFVKTALQFLVDDYGFTYQFYSTNGCDEYYNYRNKYGCFMVNQWKQFDDLDFFVTDSHGKRRILLQEYYPNELNEFRKTHKGFMWSLAKFSRPDYWDTLKMILQKEIERTNTLFGLKLSKKKVIFAQESFDEIDPKEYAQEMGAKYAADPSLYKKNSQYPADAEWKIRLAQGDYSKLWHTQCAYCGQLIDKNTPTICYATKDRVTWVCKECYTKKFKS